MRLTLFTLLIAGALFAACDEGPTYIVTPEPPPDTVWTFVLIPDSSICEPDTVWLRCKRKHCDDDE